MQKNTIQATATPPSIPDWDDIRYFLELARLGSLSAAARVLSVEHTTVARRVAALERRLQLHLFDRLPNGWQLTDEGASLLPHARRLEEEALALAQAARSHGAPSGPVRISAPPVFASCFLVPRLAPKLLQSSAIELQLVGEAREADLVRREADVALRLGRPADPRLAGRPLAELGYGLYAHPRWQNVPEGEWRFLRHGEADSQSEAARWLKEFARGRAVAFASNDLLVLREAACTGLGIALLPHFLARTDPRLVSLAPACDLRRALWLAIHPEVRRNPHIAWASALIGDIVTGNAHALV